MVHLPVMKILLVCLLLLGISSCSQSSSSGSTTPNPTPNVSTSPLPLAPTYSYTYIQQNILTPSCIQCHDSGSTVDLSTYDGVISNVLPGDPNQSSLLLDLVNGTMPPSPNRPLSSDQITYISNWIAPTTGPTDSPLPTGSSDPNASFSYLSTFVFQNQCVQCHSDYNTYSGLMGSGDVIANDPNNSPLYINVVNGTMPPTGNPLSAPEVQIVFDWINNGALNN
jgi:mono/diheme cytochrome c family protein